MPDRPVPSGPLAIVRLHEDFIGHELHDTVCQTLAAVSLTLGSLRRQQGRGQEIPAEDLEKIHANVDAASEHLRLIFEGKLLRDHPKRLLPMLQRLAKATEKRVSCRFIVEKGVEIVEGTVAHAFYQTSRIFIHLALRMGGASQIEIRLAQEKKIARLHLSFQGGLVLTPTLKTDEEKLLEAALRSGSLQWRVESGTQLVCGPN